MLLGSPLIRKQLDSRRKHSIYRRKSFSLKSDLEQLNRRIALRKDFYLFLRPFELADSIGFSNQFDGKPKSLISFEEALSRSIDAGGKRTVFCVGDGKERWGVANITFDDNLWMHEIVKFFKASVAIISMPGRSDGCINESTLIRNVPELLRKTVFVIPPLSCYTKDTRKSAVDMKSYFTDVRSKHKTIGLEIPEARSDSGLFFTLSGATGRVERQLEWQRVVFKEVHKSFWGSTRQESITSVVPTLTANRIRAALQLASVS